MFIQFMYFKIEEFRMNQLTVCLDNNFYSAFIITDWINLINI